MVLPLKESPPDRVPCRAALKHFGAIGKETYSEVIGILYAV